VVHKLYIFLFTKINKKEGQIKLNSKKKILNLKNRKIIYDFISNHPGVHQRKIIQKIDLSEGTIKHHIRHLLKNDYISKKTVMGYTRFYPSKKIGRIEKEIISILREEIPRQILINLVAGFGLTKTELSMRLDKDKKTIDYHLKKFIKLDFVESAVFKDGVMLTNRYETPYFERTPNGNEKIYRLKYPYLVYYFLVKYKDTFLDDDVTKCILDWIAYIGEGVQPKKYDKDKMDKNLDKMEDRVIKLFFEMFPVSWCA